MPENIREIPIERDQHSAFSAGDGENSIIRDPYELLIASERHIMATLLQDAADRIRNVLVQLDRRHGYAVIGTIWSRAKSAAYANAAGIASFGSVG